MEEQTDQQRADEFVKEYQTLCEKYEMKIKVIPKFVPRDDGSWSVVLETMVEKIST